MAKTKHNPPQSWRLEYEQESEQEIIDYLDTVQDCDCELCTGVEIPGHSIGQWCFKERG